VANQQILFQWHLYEYQRYPHTWFLGLEGILHKEFNRFNIKLPFETWTIIVVRCCGLNDFVFAAQVYMILSLA